MPGRAIYPGEVLREHATELEAAFSVCLAEPSTRAVHQVRSQLRRVEAQLALLDALPSLASHRQEAQKLYREMKKVRRAAGRVRDLDVQRELIEEQSSEMAGGQTKVERESLLRDAWKMRKRRKRLRHRAARELIRLIEKHGPKLTAALEGLLALLQDEVRTGVPVRELLEAIDERFSRHPALRAHHPSDEQLHDIRKAAKLARYQAENAGTSPTAQGAVKKYKQLQEDGGHWHDWLGLAADAVAELGCEHGLSIRFAALRDRSPVVYCKHLESRHSAAAR